MTPPANGAVRDRPLPVGQAAVISVPIMAAVTIAAPRPQIMGDLVLPRRWKMLGWIATVAMGLATLAMVMAMF